MSRSNIRRRLPQKCASFPGQVEEYRASSSTSDQLASSTQALQRELELQEITQLSRPLLSAAAPRSSASSAPSNGRRNEEDHVITVDNMSSNSRICTAVAVAEGTWKEILHWLGTGGAFLSCTFTAIILGSFGSFMPAHILWVCWGIVVVTPMVSLGVRPSWRVIWDHLQEHKPADLEIPEQPVGAGESAGIILKVFLAFTLLGLLANWKPAKLSVACGYSCSSRFHESLLAIVIIVLLLEGLPALIVRLDVVHRYSYWLLILKHIGQKRNDSILISLTEKEGIRLQSFQSSALSFVIIFMGSFLLGGNFGTFMTKQCYWLVWTILIAELMAEGIYRFPLHCRYGHPAGSQREQDERPRCGWQHKAAHVFRGLVQLCLSIGLITIVANDSFYPSSLPESMCDKTCRTNTKALLIVKCSCTIAQAVSIQTAPLQSLSALLLLPLLLYSALAVIFTVIAAVALIVAVCALAGAVLAVAAGAAAIAATAAIPVAAAAAVYLVLVQLCSFFKSKKCMAILVVIAIAIALVLLIGSLKEREWPWFFLTHWGAVTGHFFKRLWTGMTHAP